MGRHSAPDDDEVDAGTQIGQGTLSTDTRDGARDGARDEVQHAEPARSGRHASAGGPDAVEEPDESDGWDLIEQALAGPDSEPMPTVEPMPGAPEQHGLPDAPTERLPTVGGDPDDRTERIPTVAGATTAADTPDVGTPAAAAPDTGVVDGDRPADGDRSEVGVSEVGVDVTGPVFARADAAGEAPQAKARRRGTGSDLALMRRHGDVRARVIAAVVVPFLVFFAVFAIAGALSVRSLIWIWLPAVTAGVLVGLLLDAGHRRYPDEARNTEDAA